MPKVVKRHGDGTPYTELEMKEHRANLKSKRKELKQPTEYPDMSPELKACIAPDGDVYGEIYVKNNKIIHVIDKHSRAMYDR